MLLVTWNVLHRIHAENWREEVPDRFPDEAARIAVITKRVAAFRAQGDDTVVCLQEVSGDQLASLRAALPQASVCAFEYPRVPSLKSGAASPLTDPTEHLVTLAAHAHVRAAEAFATDPGKGFMCVDVGGLVIVNTHLTFGARRTAQLQRIAALVGDGPSVVCGDCNAPGDAVIEDLGPGFSLVDLGPAALPTRPRRDATSGKPPAIDHIVVRGLRSADGAVVDVGGESDHNLVRAFVTVT
jgi:endonuclease/exonuclease/phosphatase family metal-dependent hydrolase